tara:strand:+ start:177 stop:419 length:243 start_codon:yes stop_codon:yes gene_type:complete
MNIDMNEQELIAADIEAYDSAWHHQNLLDERRQREEDNAAQIIEKLNQAICMLDVIDPQIQALIDQMISIRDRLKKKLPR